MRKKTMAKLPSPGATDALAGLPHAPPAFVEPMQAKLVDCLPEGEQWRYELKLDGFRVLVIKTATGVQPISRNRKSLSEQFPQLVEAVRKLPKREGVLDGEIVAVDEAGQSSFQALQYLGRPRTARGSILYFAFDLLNLEGKSLLGLPLVERKRLLERVLFKCPHRLRYAGFLEGAPKAILAAIREHNLEGIVAKVTSSRYEPGRLKTRPGAKCVRWLAEWCARLVPVKLRFDPQPMVC
jgi:bifunctional non-homologous end joining protein LigD